MRKNTSLREVPFDSLCKFFFLSKNDWKADFTRFLYNSWGMRLARFQMTSSLYPETELIRYSLCFEHCHYYKDEKICRWLAARCKKTWCLQVGLSAAAAFATRIFFFLSETPYCYFSKSIRKIRTFVLSDNLSAIYITYIFFSTTISDMPRSVVTVYKCAAMRCVGRKLKIYPLSTRTRRDILNAT